MRVRRRFVLFSLPRCGTHLLLGMLRAHPELHCEPREPFHPDYGGPERHPRLLAEIWSSAQRPTRGFAIHLTQLRGRPIERLLRRDRHLYYLCLRRRNQLARFVSEEQARLTGRWCLPRGSPAPAPPRLRLDLARLQHSLAWCEQAWRDFDLRFRGRPRLNIDYEDLAADPVRVGRLVCRFLGVAPRALEPATLRQGGPPATAITNLEEVRAHLAGQGREAWLDDPYR